jgi:hypothetical protein
MVRYFPPASARTGDTDEVPVAPGCAPHTSTHTYAQSPRHLTQNRFRGHPLTSTCWLVPPAAPLAAVGDTTAAVALALALAVGVVAASAPLLRFLVLERPPPELVLGAGAGGWPREAGEGSDGCAARDCGGCESGSGVLWLLLLVSCS